MQQEINTDDSRKSIWGMRFLIVAKSYLAPVVQKVYIYVDIAIQRINLYPMDSAIGFPYTYPLDSDLSVG